MRLGPAFSLALVLLGCEARLAIGASCVRSGECEGGLACVLGRCREECLTSDDCRIGERCIVQPDTGTRACSLGEVDRCAITECPTGFVCSADDECINACGAIVACPDGVCEAGACIPRRGGPTDAGPIDGSPDTGAIDAGPCHGPACVPIVALFAGWQNFHAVDANGHLWSWGASDSNEVGDGLQDHDGCTGCAPLPVAALESRGGARIDDVTFVAGAENQTCAVRTAGVVDCWRSSAELAPHRVEWMDASTFGTLSGVVELAAGRGHVCARTDTEVWCWGQGAGGVLAAGNEVNADVRAQLATLAIDPARIWASFEHTFVLDGAGALSGFGDNAVRVLGAATPGPFVASPTHPTMPVPVRELGLADRHACALGTDLEIRCWGGAATVGSTASIDGACSCTETPQTLPHPFGVVWDGIASGPGSASSFYAWTQEGELYSWGDRFELPFAPDPTLRTDVPPVRSVAATQDSTTICALTLEGDVWCWGSSRNGEVGRGDHGTSDVYPPASVVWPE